MASDTGPSGRRPNSDPVKAPDGLPYSESNSPYEWPHADRERGTVRRAENGRTFETLVAVGNSDGSRVGHSLESLLTAVLYELRAMRLGMVVSDLIEDVEPDS